MEEQIVTLTKEEISKIREINKKYKELTDSSSKLLIEKLKLQSRIDLLLSSEKQTVDSIKQVIVDEDTILSQLVEKYGSFSIIDIEKGQISKK